MKVKYLKATRKVSGYTVNSSPPSLYHITQKQHKKKKLKIELAHDQVILLQGVFPQKTDNGIWNENVHFIGVLNAKMWKQRQVANGDWTMEMWYKKTVAYCLVLRKEALLFATTQVKMRTLGYLK